MDPLQLENLMRSSRFTGRETYGGPSQSKPIHPGEPSEHVQREHCHGLEGAFYDRRIQGCGDAFQLRFAGGPNAVRQAVIEKPAIGEIPAADRGVYTAVAND